jgi:hypothetical protein
MEQGQQEPNPCCVYTFNPNNPQWTTENYGCPNTCPGTLGDPPPGWTGPNPPTVYTQVVTDCLGNTQGNAYGGGGGQYSAQVEVHTDGTEPRIHVRLANGWTVTVKEPSDHPHAGALTTIFSTGTVENTDVAGGVIAVQPRVSTVSIQLAQGWEVRVSRAPEVQQAARKRHGSRKR